MVERTYMDAILFIPPCIPPESAGICRNPEIPPESAGINRNSGIPPESAGIDWNLQESAFNSLSKV
jgi:hypothetical protein